MQGFRIFAGTGNPALAASIARQLGASLAASAVERFPDGEVSVRLLEPVRRKDVFIVQPTSPPVDAHLLELLAFVDACRRAAAARITAVVPYFGYARADKRHGRREAIMASVVAEVLQAVGVDHVVTVDIHAAQIEGFFRVPVDSLTAVPVLTEVLRSLLAPGTVVVSPDAGRVRMATEYAHRLGTSVVILHKRRESGAETAITHVVGDVQDRPCLVVDDMITTGGTLADSVEALLKAGARSDVTLAATHGVLLSGARDRLSHEAVRQVLVTDTVLAVRDTDWPRLQVVSVAPLIAAAIGRFLADGSIAGLTESSAGPDGGEGFVGLPLDTLAGWEMAGFGEFRPAEPGVVESAGGPGVLWYTRESFEDFVLRIDWRLSRPEDNSGVLLRFPALGRADPANDWKSAVEHGSEIQIDDRGLDPESGRVESPWHRTGAIYKRAPACAYASRPCGEWNTFEIEARGPRIRVTLNGVPVSRLQDPRPGPRAGHIGLQAHDPDSRVQFRRLQIRRL